MPPRLIDHLTRPLNSHELLDPELRIVPEMINPWANFCAWIVDWGLASIVTQLAVSAWLNFLAPLGATQLTQAAHHLGLRFLLTPLSFFTITFLGLTLHSMTPGMRLFKHRVVGAGPIEAFYWAFGSMVSAALFGIPLLNTWLDQFANTQTLSHRYHYWQLTHVDAPPTKKIELTQWTDHPETARFAA